MDGNIYVDSIHHAYGMCWHHDESSFVITCYKSDFTYTISRFLIVDVDCNLFIVSSYNKKLKLFF